MGRSVNEARITTPHARGKITPGKAVHWRVIDRGLHVGYRKGQDGGSFIGRMRRDNRTHPYETERLGSADDNQPADGSAVLTFEQATKLAKQWAERRRREDDGIIERTTGKLTVSDVLASYMKWFRDHRRSTDRTQFVINAHIQPKLGSVEVSRLGTDRIRAWLSTLADTPARIRRGRGKPIRHRAPTDTADEKRRRRASANRALTILKAALNHAYREGQVQADDAWRRVKPFRNVSEARVRYLQANDCTRLLNACTPDFRNLVAGALLTGCRYGELTRMQAADYNRDAKAVLVRESKSGKPRHVPLNGEGARLFDALTAGRASDALIFARDNGKPWGKSHQKRPLDDAAKVAKLADVTFHTLRHTYASLLAMKGVPMQMIAAVLGHTDTRMTEKHYAHLSPSHVADVIRANMPTFDIGVASNVARL